MPNALMEREIDQNYDYFQSRFNEFCQDKAGLFALLKGRSIVGFFEKMSDACREGDRLFPDGIYSIQPVEPDPVDLGYFSHV